jgi:hypothetical protein
MTYHPPPPEVMALGHALGCAESIPELDAIVRNATIPDGWEQYVARMRAGIAGQIIQRASAEFSVLQRRAQFRLIEGGAG